MSIEWQPGPSRRTRRRVWIAFVAALATAAAPADEVLERAWVPSAEKPHGEVRLIERDGERVVQTLLYSKLLKRVVAKIADRERRNWPTSREGHEDSEAYVAALAAAREQVAERSRNRQDPSERREGLLIEFVWNGTEGRVVLAEPTIEIDDDDWRIVDRETLQVLDLSSGYVRDDMRLIAVDSLGLDPQQAERYVP